MGYLVFASLMVLVATLIAIFVKVPVNFGAAKKGVIAFCLVVGLAVGGTGAFQYNDAGYCQFIQTIAGTEGDTCELGWYFQGWGKSTAWPHFITIANTHSTEAQGSSIQPPYSVRLSDNWNGDVTQTTRFGIPQDSAQFRKMHKDFRSVDRLITTTLRPAINASLDSVANLFSMEEYYAGGQRDQFKTEFKDAVVKGRAKVTQHVDYTQGNVNTIGGQAANDSVAAQDSSDVGTLASRNVTMQKVLDRETGEVIREVHNYVGYGITVAIALLENLDPDDKFEKQIQARKDAASRRIVAQEERREQEEQRLLAIQTGETEIAKEQAAARVVQIKQTTDAETTKKLALIKASRQLEEAEIAKQTAAINLETARIEADAKVVTADAAAYEKAKLLAADNALQIKIDAIVKMNGQNADAFAKRNVPYNVIYTGGSEGGSLGANEEIANIAATQMLKNLQALDLNMNVAPTGQAPTSIRKQKQ